jgi:hypothetical protein
LGLVAKTELLEEGVVVYYNGVLAKVAQIEEYDVDELKKEEADLNMDVEIQQAKVDYLNSGELDNVDPEAKKDLDGMDEEAKANFMDSFAKKKGKLASLQSEIQAGENDLVMRLHPVGEGQDMEGVVPADVEIVSIRREPPPDQFAEGDVVTPVLASHPMFRRFGKIIHEEDRNIVVSFNHMNFTFQNPELLSFLSRETSEGEVDRILKDFPAGDMSQYPKHEKYMKEMLEESYGVDADEMAAEEVVEMFVSLGSQPREFFELMRAVNSENRQNMARVLANNRESTVGTKDELKARLIGLLPSPLSGNCVSEIKSLMADYGIDVSGTDAAVVARLKMILNKHSGKTGSPTELSNLFVQNYVKDETLQSVLNFLSSQKMLPNDKPGTETAFSTDPTVSSLQKILKNNKLNYAGTDSEVKSRVVGLLNKFNENQSSSVSSTASTLLNSPVSKESTSSVASPSSQESKKSSENSSQGVSSPSSDQNRFSSGESLTSPENSAENVPSPTSSDRNRFSSGESLTSPENSSESVPSPTSSDRNRFSSGESLTSPENSPSTQKRESPDLTP